MWVCTSTTVYGIVGVLMTVKATTSSKTAIVLSIILHYVKLSIVKQRGM